MVLSCTFKMSDKTFHVLTEGHKTLQILLPLHKRNIQALCLGVCNDRPALVTLEQQEDLSYFS